MNPQVTQVIIPIFAIIVPIIAAILGWLIREKYENKNERQRIVQVENTSLTSFQLPKGSPSDLRMEFKGRQLSAIHKNTFEITNKSYESVAQIEIRIRLGTKGNIVNVQLEDKIETRGTQVIRAGHKQITLDIPFLNSTALLKDKLFLHIHTEQPIESVHVTGGGHGWAIEYQGKIEEGLVTVSMPTSRSFIAIEGPIGVGKTTLARLLQKTWNTDILLEKFEENPFLEDFYGDRDLYAFQTQLHFLLSRYEQMRDLKIQDQPIISDYIFDKDKIFANINLQENNQLKKYYYVFDSLRRSVLKPDLIIYLSADIDVLLKRIERRGRAFEKDMDRNYLEILCKEYDEFFDNYADSIVLPIDTSRRDIRNNQQDQNAILDMINSTFSS